MQGSHLCPHLEVADDTVRLGFVQPAESRSPEATGSADEKVACGRVTAALRAAMAEIGFLSAHSTPHRAVEGADGQRRAQAGERADKEGE